MIKKLLKGMQMGQRYIAYRKKAKNEFKIHSPFMYDLYTHVIKDKTFYADYETIENIRRGFLHSEQRINVSDLGAGQQSGEKRISRIAKNALKSPKNARLIYRLIRRFQYQNILELGTSLGITTSYMAHANPDARVVSIEGCPETAKTAKQGWNAQQLTNVSVEIGNFSDVLPNLLEKMPRLDLVFFDGNHQKQPTLDYFQSVLPHLHENSLLIFDDIHWSKEMEEAWETIIADPRVYVSLDLFQMGIVFVNPRYEKQHYVLKF